MGRAFNTARSSAGQPSPSNADARTSTLSKVTSYIEVMKPSNARTATPGAPGVYECEGYISTISHGAEKVSGRTVHPAQIAWSRRGCANRYSK